jgi:hypothetical protein
LSEERGGGRVWLRVDWRDREIAGEGGLEGSRTDLNLCIQAGGVSSR